MANTPNIHAAIVEEELPHEIYANLLDNPTSHVRTPATSFCSASGASQYQQPSRSNGNRARAPGEAALILADANNYDECDSKPSSSQFINFYRRSCQTAQQQTCSDAAVGGGDPQKPTSQTTSDSDATASAAAAGKSNKTRESKDENTKSQPYKRSSTTKSERRRIAKLKREQTIRKDKRIRMMLRSDFTEEDELLYRRLTR